MTQHDDIVRLKHILEHAREAVAMIESKERADLRRERMLELSLIRLIEVVGEAAARVTLEGQAKYPSIPPTSAYIYCLDNGLCYFENL